MVRCLNGAFPSYLSSRSHTNVHPYITALSIDYFTRSLSVMGEVARVLRPGGMVAIAFSNRLFIQKVRGRGLCLYIHT